MTNLDHIKEWIKDVEYPNPQMSQDRYFESKRKLSMVDQSDYFEAQRQLSANPLPHRG